MKKQKHSVTKKLWRLLKNRPSCAGEEELMVSEHTKKYFMFAQKLLIFRILLEKEISHTQEFLKLNLLLRLMSPSEWGQNFL